MLKWSENRCSFVFGQRSSELGHGSSHFDNSGIGWDLEGSQSWDGRFQAEMVVATRAGT